MAFYPNKKRKGRIYAFKGAHFWLDIDFSSNYNYKVGMNVTMHTIPTRDQNVTKIMAMGILNSLLGHLK